MGWNDKISNYLSLQKFNSCYIYGYSTLDLVPAILYSKSGDVYFNKLNNLENLQLRIRTKIKNIVPEITER